MSVKQAINAGATHSFTNANGIVLYGRIVGDGITYGTVNFLCLCADCTTWMKEPLHVFGPIRELQPSKLRTQTIALKRGMVRLHKKEQRKKNQPGGWRHALAYRLRSLRSLSASILKQSLRESGQ
jgi:hypothetical protein